MLLQWEFKKKLLITLPVSLCRSSIINVRSKPLQMANMYSVNRKL